MSGAPQPLNGGQLFSNFHTFSGAMASPFEKHMRRLTKSRQNLGLGDLGLPNLDKT